jgi:hypothetical protein
MSLVDRQHLIGGNWIGEVLDVPAPKQGTALAASSSPARALHRNEDPAGSSERLQARRHIDAVPGTAPSSSMTSPRFT